MKSARPVLAAVLLFLVVAVEFTGRRNNTTQKASAGAFDGVLFSRAGDGPFLLTGETHVC
ncbi:hypothetical protein [Salmonella enterica]|uniref:hypothetical protein n=1 Tax=Salmonella enterica TaxID=28901 RepID=UPI001F07094F|nr:hypothetical protein [Salmonella enterica]